MDLFCNTEELLNPKFLNEGLVFLCILHGILFMWCNGIGCDVLSEIIHSASIEGIFVPSF